MLKVFFIVFFLVKIVKKNVDHNCLASYSILRRGPNGIPSVMRFFSCMCGNSFNPIRSFRNLEMYSYKVIINTILIHVHGWLKCIIILHIQDPLGIGQSVEVEPQRMHYMKHEHNVTHVLAIELKIIYILQFFSLLVRYFRASSSLTVSCTQQGVALRAPCVIPPKLYYCVFY